MIIKLPDFRLHLRFNRTPLNLETEFSSLKGAQENLRYKGRSGNFIMDYRLIIFSCRKLSWEWRDACCSETCWPQNSGGNQLLILHLAFMNMIQHEKVYFMKNPKTAETSRIFWENLANELRHSTLFFQQKWRPGDPERRQTNINRTKTPTLKHRWKTWSNNQRLRSQPREMRNATQRLRAQPWWAH